MNVCHRFVKPLADCFPKPRLSLFHDLTPRTRVSWVDRTIETPRQRVGYRSHADFPFFRDTFPFRCHLPIETQFRPRKSPMKRVKRKAIILSFLCIAVIGIAKAQNFASATNYPTGSLPDGSTAADFNNDGNIDIVVGNSGTSTLSLFLGHGDGSLVLPSTIQVGLQPIA